MGRTVPYRKPHAPTWCAEQSRAPGLRSHGARQPRVRLYSMGAARRLCVRAVVLAGMLSAVLSLAMPGCSFPDYGMARAHAGSAGAETGGVDGEAGDPPIDAGEGGSETAGAAGATGAAGAGGGDTPPQTVRRGRVRACSAVGLAGADCILGGRGCRGWHAAELSGGLQRRRPDRLASRPQCARRRVHLHLYRRRARFAARTQCCTFSATRHVPPEPSVARPQPRRAMRCRALAPVARARSEAFLRRQLGARACVLSNRSPHRPGI